MKSCPTMSKIATTVLGRPLKNRGKPIFRHMSSEEEIIVLQNLGFILVQTSIKSSLYYLPLLRLMQMGGRGGYRMGDMGVYLIQFLDMRSLASLVRVHSDFWPLKLLFQKEEALKVVQEAYTYSYETVEIPPVFPDVRRSKFLADVVVLNNFKDPKNAYNYLLRSIKSKFPWHDTLRVLLRCIEILYQYTDDQRLEDWMTFFYRSFDVPREMITNILKGPHSLTQCGCSECFERQYPQPDYESESNYDDYPGYDYPGYDYPDCDDPSDY